MTEGIAICQVKDNHGNVIDEKHFFITSDPNELIDYRFEGYDQTLIDTDIINVDRNCGPDENISYVKEDVIDFYIDFVQHYEHVRLHSNHIRIQNIKHENEGYYECTVRLRNGLIGVRVFFLSVGGNPREITNRERQIYAEINDSITILCPIFSAMPAWFTFILPKDSRQDVSMLTGHDYLRIKQVLNTHNGICTCRATTTDDNQGFSLSSNIYLNVYGPPEYVKPRENEYESILLERNIENILRCSIEGNPKPSYQWFLGNVQVITNEEIISNKIDYVITWDKNNAPESNQTVTCIAKNNRGTKRQVYNIQFNN
ncbi:hypothetical protein I4U23_028795 [Adineta vaga]|nr:hypothetical protein I4U23_028795 [Adineta vaga]